MPRGMLRQGNMRSEQDEAREKGERLPYIECGYCHKLHKKASGLTTCWCVRAASRDAEPPKPLYYSASSSSHDHDFLEGSHDDPPEPPPAAAAAAAHVEIDDPDIDDPADPPPAPAPLPPASIPVDLSRLKSPLEYLLLSIPPWLAANQLSANATDNLLLLLQTTFRMIKAGLSACGIGAIAGDIFNLEIYEQWLKKFLVSLETFPSTLAKVRSTIGIEVDSFVSLAVCPNTQCGAIYTPEEYSVTRMPDRKCSRFQHVSVEQSPKSFRERTEFLANLGDKMEKSKREKMQARCDTLLLEPRSVRATALGSAKDVPRPISLSPYIGVLPTLTRILLRTGIEDECRRWESRYDLTTGKRKHTNFMTDVYDGQMWEDFMYLDKTTRRRWVEPPAGEPRGAAGARIPFLADEAILTLALAFNIDWWQPFDSTYSMGAIYLTILNLPRDVRYLPENMILVALLPGPKSTSRPAHQSMLARIVVELLELLGEDCLGTIIKTATAPEGRKVRAFLHSIICDEPAARATIGMLGHGANVNCAWCKLSGHGANSLSDVIKKAAALGHRDWRAPELQRTGDQHRQEGQKWVDMGWTAAAPGDISRVVEEVEEEESKSGDEDSDDMMVLDDSEEESPPVSRKRSFKLEAGSQPPPKRAKSISQAAAALPASSSAKSSAAAASSAKIPSKKDLTEQEKETGSRYSAFMELPYLDLPRATPSDVMHNIHLGVVKSLVKLLNTPLNDDQVDILRAFAEKRRVAEERRRPDQARPYSIALSALGAGSGTKDARTIVNKAAAEFLANFVRRSECPSDLSGRLPHKIDSKWKAFKATEWNNWICIFAVPALRELSEQKPTEGHPLAPLLLPEHIKLFERLQQVCVILQKYVIDASIVEGVKNEIMIVQEGLEAVWKETETLFGSKAVTPNMHWAQHLPDHIKLFGPPAGWWCMSYERFNGLLAAVPRTPTYIEICTARRAILLMHVREAIFAAVQGIGNSDIPGYANGRDLHHILQLTNGKSEGLVLANKSSDVTTSLVRTAKGRASQRYTLDPKDWNRVYQSFCDMRWSVSRVQDDGVLGNEPYPGQLVRLKAPGSLSSNADVYDKYIKVDHLRDAIKRHFGAHFDDALRYHARLALANDPARQEFDRSWTLATNTVGRTNCELARLKFLVEQCGFDQVGSDFAGSFARPAVYDVFDTLHMGGDVYASQLNARSIRSSNVIVTYPVAAGPASKMIRGYGQVQFYFRYRYYVQHIVGGQKQFELLPAQRDHLQAPTAVVGNYDFAVMKWYLPYKRGDADNFPDDTFPRASCKLRGGVREVAWAAPSNMDIIPVARIVSRILICPSACGAFLNLLPIGSNEHASSS